MSAKLLPALCALFLAGCAATPDGDSSAAMLADSSEATEQEVVGADKEAWICKHEKMLGSNRIEKVCYKRDVSRSLQRQTQDGMFRRTRNTACTDCSNGG